MKQGDYIIGIQKERKKERKGGNNKKHKNCYTKDKKNPKTYCQKTKS